MALTLNSWPRLTFATINLISRVEFVTRHVLLESSCLYPYLRYGLGINYAIHCMIMSIYNLLFYLFVCNSLDIYIESKSTGLTVFTTDYPVKTHDTYIDIHI